MIVAIINPESECVAKIKEINLKYFGTWNELTNNYATPIKLNDGNWCVEIVKDTQFNYELEFVGREIRIITSEDIYNPEMDANSDGVVTDEEKTSFLQSVKNWFSNLW